MQAAAERELGEAKETWEARGQRQRAELREMEARLEQQERAHRSARAALQRDVSTLQQRLVASQVGLHDEARSGWQGFDLPQCLPVKLFTMGFNTAQASAGCRLNSSIAINTGAHQAHSGVTLGSRPVCICLQHVCPSADTSRLSDDGAASNC